MGGSFLELSCHSLGCGAAVSFPLPLSLEKDRGHSTPGCAMSQDNVYDEHCTGCGDL